MKLDLNFRQGSGDLKLVRSLILAMLLIAGCNEKGAEDGRFKSGTFADPSNALNCRM